MTNRPPKENHQRNPKKQTVDTPQLQEREKERERQRERERERDSETDRQTETQAESERLRFLIQLRRRFGRAVRWGFALFC